jgi:inosine-uridine nucleoside N-ribohydrolase
MKRFIFLLLATASLISAAPVPIIFDTDIGNDVDDVMAMAMIHQLQKRGACKLLAMTVTKDHPKAAPFVDAVNTFYGRPDIPIGVVRDGPTKEQGRFLGLIDDAEKYPHDLKSGTEAPEAVDLLRKTLAAQPDHSVTLIQVGFFTNFARLLSSAPDQHSPLSGIELIRQKVTVLSIMAGAFQTIEDSNYYCEYNVIKDIPSVRQLAKEWPTPILWSGYEIGVAAAYPHESIEKDFNSVAHHPVKEAYYLFNPPPHDRPTWDLTSVLVAIHPDRGYFDLSPVGRIEVTDEGFTRFRKDKTGRDRFLILDPLQTARVKEALVQLCASPP